MKFAAALVLWVAASALAFPVPTEVDSPRAQREPEQSCEPRDAVLVGAYPLLTGLSADGSASVHVEWLASAAATAEEPQPQEGMPVSLAGLAFAAPVLGVLMAVRRKGLAVLVLLLSPAACRNAGGLAEAVALGNSCLRSYLMDPRRPQHLHDRIRDIAGELVARNANSADGLRLQGHLARLDGKPAEAVELLRKADALRPFDPAVSAVLMQSLLEHGQIADAEAYASGAIAAQKDTAALYDVFYLHRISKGDIAGAEEVVRAKVANLPKVASGPLQKARHLQAAARVASDAKELELGWAAFGEKRYRDAERIFRRLHTPGATDLTALEGLIESLFARNQFRSALALLEEEAQRSSGARGIRMLLAAAEVRAGQYESALAEYRRLAEEHADDAEIQRRLGRVYQLTGDPVAAASNARKAVELKPDDAAALAFLAQVLASAGHANEAVDAYRRSIRLRPSNPEALNNLAYLLADTGGDLNEAQNLAEKALRISPDSAAAADTLGFVYLQKGMTDRALAVFADLVAKFPDQARFHYRHAMALLAKGDRTAAQKELLRALSANPEKPDEPRIRRLLDRTS